MGSLFLNIVTVVTIGATVVLVLTSQVWASAVAATGGIIILGSGLVPYVEDAIRKVRGRTGGLHG